MIFKDFEPPSDCIDLKKNMQKNIITAATYNKSVWFIGPIGLPVSRSCFGTGSNGPKTNTRGKYSARSFAFLFYTHIFITIIITVVIIFNPAPTPANKRAGQVDDKIITSHKTFPRIRITCRFRACL